MRSVKNTTMRSILAGALLFMIPYKAQSTETNVVFVTNDMTLTWNWVTEYAFNADSPTNGVLSGDTNGWYLSGLTNLVQAVPDSGYYFDQWTGSDVPIGEEKSNPLEVILTGPKTNIVANYLQVPQPHITGFDGTQVGITNLIPSLGYAVQNTTNLTLPSWVDKVPFTASDTYTSILVTMTNNPEFLRVKYKE